jgi:YidC/Oxa1 family membrane protein insertase
MRSPTHPSTSRARWIVLGLFLVLAAMALVACTAAGATSSPTAVSTAATPSVAASGSPAAGGSVVASPTPSPSPTPEPKPLKPAQLGTDPMSVLAWLFTPIFQALFIILAGVYALTGNVGIAIIVLTLLIRALIIPLFRKQIVSQKRMQMIQPEMKALQKRYKGDRSRISQAQMELYKERGVNPMAGCLPMILQMFLLMPMYFVISGGLTNYDPSAFFSVFGTKVVPLDCPRVVNGVVDMAHPCINTVVAGINVGNPNILFTVFGFGLGGLALVAAILQLLQSRMVMPPASPDPDPSAATQRQMMYLMPLMTLLFSGLPAGLFIYWIVTTIFGIVQQYLIVGWGSMFPLFGWTPGFAKDHTPRFPVTMPIVPISGKSVAETRHKPDDRSASAASTVRPNTRRRGRRGRRR